MNILIALAIILAGGVGMTQVAGNSVPGDALYPVKIHVNENLKHAVAFTSEAEANVSAEIIAERAEEARLLESEGRLDAEAKADITASIQSEMEAWAMMNQEMREDGNTEGEAASQSALMSNWQANGALFQSLNISADASVNGGSNTDTGNINVDGTINTDASTELNGDEKTEGASSSSMINGLLETQ